MSAWQTLFAEHIDTVTGHCEEALQVCREQGEPYDGILFHAGKPVYYHADDHPVEFKSVPHFRRFASRSRSSGRGAARAD